MTDRILNSAWWLAAMSMICVLAGLSLVTGYFGFFELLAGRFHSAILLMPIGVVAGTAAFKLARHRNDLW